MSIASRIQQAREAKGMKQVDLANMVGVQPGAIWNYENGKSSPKEPVVFRLMSALGVDANYLYQDEMREACAKIPSCDYRAWATPLIDAYEQASDDTQHAACAVLRIPHVAPISPERAKALTDRMDQHLDATTPKDA